MIKASSFTKSGQLRRELSLVGMVRLVEVISSSGLRISTRRVISSVEIGNRESIPSCSTWSARVRASEKVHNDGIAIVKRKSGVLFSTLIYLKLSIIQ